MIISLGFYKRPTDLTHQQFLDHWKNIYPPLVRSAPGGETLMWKFVQDHVQPYPFAPNADMPNDGGLLCDGFSRRWFPDMTTREAFSKLPFIRNEVIEDELRFADMTATRWMVLDQPHVQFGRT